MTPEAFNSHPVLEKIEQLNQLLIGIDAREKIDIDNLLFFDATYNYIKEKLRLTLPVLVQEAELAGLASEIEGGMSQINSFMGNSNIGHLTNATNNFASALTRIKNLPSPLSKSDFDFAKSITNFEKTAKEKYKNLEEINIKLKEELEKVQDSLTSKENQITEIGKKLEAKEVEIQNVLSTYNTEFANLKSTANSNIEADRKKFQELVEADRTDFKKTNQEEKEEFKKTFTVQTNTIDTGSAALINKINIKLEEANKIVNIIGNVGVTGNYQNIANQNKKTANFWRWTAVFFMVLMSGLLVWSIIELGNSDFNLYKSLVRIIAAAVLTYPAIYAARESTKHRNLETKNRNIELELASIGPFIEMLPEEKKQKIKEELVNKYFGNHDADIAKNEANEDVSIGGFEKILKAILPFIKK